MSVLQAWSRFRPLFLWLWVGVALSGCQRAERVPSAAVSVGAVPAEPAASSGPQDTRTFAKPSEAELKQRLTPLEYEVTQNAATEPPFHDRFWDNHEPGLYVVATGEPLFGGYTCHYLRD